MEYYKEYYIKNKEKIAEKARAYYKINKDKINERDKKYYMENKDKIKLRIKNYQKAGGYKYDKTRRVEGNLRRYTRRKYPIGNKKCECGAKALHHHHTTTPMEIDKFILVCENCHHRLHHVPTIGK